MSECEHKSCIETNRKKTAIDTYIAAIILVMFETVTYLSNSSWHKLNVFWISACTYVMQCLPF